MKRWIHSVTSDCKFDNPVRFTLKVINPDSKKLNITRRIIDDVCNTFTDIEFLLDNDAYGFIFCTDSKQHRDNFINELGTELGRKFIEHRWDT